MDEYEKFWQARCDELGIATPPGGFIVRRLGNSPALCEQLLGLIESGEKTGTFSLPRELTEVGGLPKGGDHLILTDYDGGPRCLVRMDVCELVPFAGIGPEHVACEGPAARNVEVWRQIHKPYWEGILKGWGESFRDDMPVAYQRFTLLWPAVN